MSLKFIRLAVLGMALTAIAAGQIAILQIQVVEGEGTVYAPGAHSGHAIAVSVTDDAGRPVAGAAVSFHLPEDGPGGSFVNGLRTNVAMTDGSGRAMVRGLVANRVSGRFQVRIVASKEQARAGTVSFQYVGERTAGAARHSNWKWIAAVAGGGVVAGVLASRGSGPVAVAAAPPVVVAPTVTIGTPSISVGKP